MPRLPFARLIKEIAQRLCAENHIHGLRIQYAASNALQEASEAYMNMTMLFENTVLFLLGAPSHLFEPWTCKICGFKSYERSEFARHVNVQCDPEDK